MPESRSNEHDIVGLGAAGDGIVETPGGVRFVEGALPGERWRVGGGGAELLSTPSPQRTEPSCRHFGACGGCVAQHMDQALYAGWKRDIVVRALAHRGLDTLVAPLVAVAAATRRRAVLTALVTSTGVCVGYRAEGSHDLVAIAECPVLVPEIVAALPALGRLARRLGTPGEALRFTVTATVTGLDVVIAGAAGKPTAEVRAAVSAIAETARLAAVTIDGEEIVSRARPQLDIAGVRVVLPAGTFIQASAAAEAAMRDLVIAAIGKARNVADLFCGLGTFALAIARRAKVLAADSDEAALSALGEARRMTQGLKPIATLRRDLMREPLSRKELEPYDCVVFDPPRAGAKDQARMLARSKVAKVIAVSCDPGTLARDLRILVDGGYIIEKVTPIDQFLWSSHVETVVVLRR